MTGWEQTDDISTSGEAIVEDWCDRSNGIYSHPSVSWTRYAVTVNGQGMVSPQKDWSSHMPGTMRAVPKCLPRSEFKK